MKKVPLKKENRDRQNKIRKEVAGGRSPAERHKTTVEIMLRINGVPAETVWKIFDSWLVDQLRRRRDPQSSPKEMDWETIGEGAIPENLKLVSGQEIYVPEKISRE